MICDNCGRKRKTEDTIRSAFTGRHYCANGTKRCDELGAARRRAAKRQLKQEAVAA
jgi:hypothetical protein